MSLFALIIDYLEYLESERNVSQRTVKNYDHCLRRFSDFVGEINPSFIGPELIGQYRLYLAGYMDEKTQKPLKKITQNFFLIALRNFLKYLAANGIKTLSAEKIELGTQDPSPLKVLGSGELERLFMAPDVTQKKGLRDRTILEVLFSTGLRVSELVSLNVSLIDLQSRRFEVTGKGGKKRIVFISDSAAVWLERYILSRKDCFAPLFIRFQGRVDSASGGEKMRLTPRSIERIVEKYVKLSGLSTKATPHTLRYNFTTNLLVNGADVKNVQEMLGNSNISTIPKIKLALPFSSDSQVPGQG